MIQRIRLLRNVGPFNSVSPGADLGLARLSLVYGDNGRGKTTLSAILRSLATNDPLPIKERRRLGTTAEPHVVIDCDGGTASAVFQGNAWSRHYPAIRIFDDMYVSENVYSGLEVNSAHRQNLHELIIGRQGVALAKQVEVLTLQIQIHHEEMRDRAAAIFPTVRGGLSVDAYCALENIADIDASIQAAERRHLAVVESAQIRSTPEFVEIPSPTLDFDSAIAIVGRTLSDLDAQAVVALNNHLSALGDQAEQWLAQGMDFARRSSGQGEEHCPFCSQSTQQATLVNHYRTYFSDIYSQLKQDIQVSLTAVESSLSGDSLAGFQRSWGVLQGRHQFWSRFLSVPGLAVDLAELSTQWQEARDSLAGILETKLAAPLEPGVVSAEVTARISTFRGVLARCAELSASLVGTNAGIQDLKREAQSGNAVALAAEVQRLRAVKARHSVAGASLCQAYLSAKAAKEGKEALKVTARAALDTHRASVFPRYEGLLNRYLELFNAGFRVAEVQAANPRGTPSSSFQLKINNCSVPLTASAPGEPAFKSTLSAGDRNALALAFFFACLAEEADISSIVVVIDDPMSSLDDGRSLTTAQEIRGLSERARQTIVLSHDRRFLCTVRDHSDLDHCKTMRVALGPDGSILEEWNASAESISEYDRRHETLRNYSRGEERNFRMAAESLRPVLEGYMRVSCCEHFSSDDLIGPVLNHARDLAASGNPIMPDTTLAELKLILEYANRFHHNTNTSCTSALDSISEPELLGFVKRVLVVTAIG